MPPLLPEATQLQERITWLHTLEIPRGLMSPVRTCWPTLHSQPCSHVPVIWSLGCFKFPSLSEVSMFKSSEILVERRKQKPPQWITQYWSGHAVGTYQPPISCGLNSGCLHVSLGSPGNPAHSGEAEPSCTRGHTTLTIWLLGSLQLKQEAWFLLLLPGSNTLPNVMHMSLALPPRNFQGWRISLSSLSNLKRNWKSGLAWECPVLPMNSTTIYYPHLLLLLFWFLLPYYHFNEVLGESRGEQLAVCTTIQSSSDLLACTCTVLADVKTVVPEWLCCLETERPVNSGLFRTHHSLSVFFKERLEESSQTYLEDRKSLLDQKHMSYCQVFGK